MILIIRMVTFGGGNITECSSHRVWNDIDGRRSRGTYNLPEISFQTPRYEHSVMFPTTKSPSVMLYGLVSRDACRIMIAYHRSRHPNVWPTIALSNLTQIQLKLYPHCRKNAADLNAVLTLAVWSPWTLWSSSNPFCLFSYLEVTHQTVSDGHRVIVRFAY